MRAELRSDNLNHLNKHKYHDYGNDHYIRAETLVAVTDCKVSEPAADCASHCRIPDKVDNRERYARDKRRHCFWQKNLHYYLEVRGAHCARRLNNTWINFFKRGFYNAGNERSGGYRKRNNRRGRSDTRSNDNASEREKKYHQYDKRER